MGLFPTRKARKAPTKRRTISGKVVTGPDAKRVGWSRDESYPGKRRERTRAANKVAKLSRRRNRDSR